MSTELHSITSEPSQVIQSFENISKAFIENANSTDPLTEGRMELIRLVEPLCDDLDSYIKFLRGEAETTLNAGEPLLPSYLLLSKSGLACPIILPHLPNSREDVAVLMACFCATLNTAPIDAYSFMSEVFMAESTPETDKELAGVSPSKRSDRKEGILIRVANHTATRIAIYEITTTPDGIKVLSEENKVPPEASETVPNILLQNLFEIAASTKQAVEKHILAKDGGEFQQPQIKRTLH